MEIMEAIKNNSYFLSAECPVCGKRLSRGYHEETVYCQSCGQRLLLKGFADAEIKQAQFDKEQDCYED